MSQIPTESKARGKIQNKKQSVKLKLSPLLIIKQNNIFISAPTW